MQPVTVVGKKQTRILPMIPSSCASTSMTALSVSCTIGEWSSEMFHRSYCCAQHTISSSTSPAVKLSPSLFFHDAIPPSVMVGDIAGILNLVIARETDVAWSPGIKMSASVEKIERRNVHLRGWQRADLSNGEAMIAERKETPFADEPK